MGKHSFSAMLPIKVLYACMYTHKHAYSHTNTHVHTHTNTQKQDHHKCANINHTKYILELLPTLFYNTYWENCVFSELPIKALHVCMCTKTHTSMHIHTYKHIKSCIYTHIHMHAHTHTYTHKSRIIINMLPYTT